MTGPTPAPASTRSYARRGPLAGHNYRNGVSGAGSRRQESLMGLAFVTGAKSVCRKLSAHRLPPSPFLRLIVSAHAPALLLFHGEWAGVRLKPTLEPVSVLFIVRLRCTFIHGDMSARGTGTGEVCASLHRQGRGWLLSRPLESRNSGEIDGIDRAVERRLSPPR